MKKYTSILLVLLSTSAIAESDVIDTRQIVTMPAPMKELFLKNMRGHMESLDRVIGALAEGSLNDAADISEIGMGMGHGKVRQCDDDKKGDNQHQHASPVTEHKGKAFGKFMPKEMKMMGMNLHISANEFSDVARTGNMGEAYKSLRNITAACVACHQSFQVK